MAQHHHGQRRKPKAFLRYSAVLFFLLLVATYPLWIFRVLHLQSTIIVSPGELSTFKIPPVHDKAIVATKQQQIELLPSDGTFNGHDIYFRHNHHPIHSTVHCVGENFQKATSWFHRSCKFQNICFDVQRQDFVLFASPEEQQLETMLLSEKHNPGFLIDVSSTMNTSVSIGGINPKWTWKTDIPRLEWFPTILPEPPKEGYYELGPDVIMTPFHSLAGFNPGHLVWDDFLPIYTLLNMFQMLPQGNNNTNLLLMRYVLQGKGMWSTCDSTDLKKETCRTMFQKFIPLMGISPQQFSTNQDFSFVEHELRSNYICARTGVAGIGMLTDHGTKLHGWDEKDYSYTHNHGRGAMLYNFRQFLVGNLGLSLKNVNSDPPYKITFSMFSSQGAARYVDFTRQMMAVKAAFAEDQVFVQSYQFNELSMEEQVRVATESAIFVTVCGGGAVTATFLPLGGSVFLYYDDKGGFIEHTRSYRPARLDWDYFNNAAYIRAHWFPTATMNTRDHLAVIIQLIRHELDVISQFQNR